MSARANGAELILPLLPRSRTAVAKIAPKHTTAKNLIRLRYKLTAGASPAAELNIMNLI